MLIKTLLCSALLLLGALDTSLAAPSKKCKKPRIRKEWRALSKSERLAFIKAVRCLHSKPAPKKLIEIHNGTTTYYEAFANQHKAQTPWAHTTGLFLPWHRLFMDEFEKTLAKVCGYKGTIPYWDYTLDSGPGKNISTSPVFDNVYGFGGNGEYDPHFANPEEDRWGGGCVSSGPFKDFKFHVNYGMHYDFQYLDPPRCLKRNIWYQYAKWTERIYEDYLYELPSFTLMQQYLELNSTEPGWESIHSGGHYVVGGPPPQFPRWHSGTGSEQHTAPLEPLFWLHHTNLDRIWAHWQSLKPENQWAIGGLYSPLGTDIIGEVTEDFPPGEVTLDGSLDLGYLGGKRTELKVGQIMSTVGKNSPEGHKGYFCYEYQNPPGRKMKKGN